MTQVQQGTQTDDAGEAGRWVTARVGASGFRTVLEARTHSFVADEPRALGGSDEGPTPYEYLLGAVASCTVITLRMYADRKGWSLESATVALRTARSHERDCEQCEVNEVGIPQIERQVELTGSLSAEQRQRLLQIADRCPVKQTLERGMRIVNAA
jgi:putative redox protein